LVYPESAEIVKASGARYGGFGIETLHNQAGKRIGKGLGKERIIETLTMSKEVWGDEVLVGACMISGLPFEPIESIHETIDWTMTTDLLHGATWQHLTLVSPDIKIIANSKLEPEPKNRIDSDFDKFGVKWLDGENWINSAGVTNSQAMAAVLRYKPNNPWAGRFNQYLYADIRSAGVTHEQISKVRTGGLTTEDIDSSLVLTKHRISKRLNKLLTIKV